MRGKTTRMMVHKLMSGFVSLVRREWEQIPVELRLVFALVGSVVIFAAVMTVVTEMLFMPGVHSLRLFR
jgi:hypothetical protein